MALVPVFGIKFCLHPAFAQLPFDHPLYILFSSGTTGVPKCIVHGAGGTLLQHLKELAAHGPRAPATVFYFTTCGWMMWNWLVSGWPAAPRCCCSTARPSPGPEVLWRYAEQERHHHLRHQRQVHRALEKAARLAARRPMTWTACARCSCPPARRCRRELRLRLCDIKPTCTCPSISGGTDICPASCSATRAAGLSRRDPGPGSGMAVEVWTTTAPRWSAKRASWSAPALPVHADRFLERPGRRALPRRLLRALRQRLDPRRLRRADRRTAA
jgi:acetoacetyl-CoA synthetase